MLTYTRDVYITLLLFNFMTHGTHLAMIKKLHHYQTYLQKFAKPLFFVFAKHICLALLDPCIVILDGSDLFPVLFYLESHFILMRNCRITY